MILKWQTILTNWINCYKNENIKKEQIITPENLLNIFTHIHESVNLEESKSSKFEANTIEDFIVEKYPAFKFENGTLEATSEEDIYVVASLLLYFICVNSKNAEIKRAMCSKLSAGDQETIMKFSKSLMECSPILYADVEAAITEACGPDASTTVAETPPALRSLHGEVRRLQAALDAERFDRNYLQDELARTNLKLEKLTKVKEQYKLDIVNLKGKISLCCGEKKESHREARADEFIAKLQRQLQDLETRLEDTLSQLEDVQQERDGYKQKVTDLKQERDKWLSLSQQEADRAGQLADQLDVERRTVATLRDLVSELRQHNRNNGLDSSMLECDDPDTSIQSLNNISVCNEACANVIEVQLGEERAKIEVLKHQIQSLQEQLTKASQNFESEKLALEAVITEKDNDITKLKQQFNEEVTEKSNLKTSYEQEIHTLNKKILDMSQIIKDLQESSKHVLEQKIQEIQLLQNRFDKETDELGLVIKNLQKEVEGQHILKGQCDEEVIKLNNKVVEISNTLNDVKECSKLEAAKQEQEVSRLQLTLAEEIERASSTIRNLKIEMKEQSNLKTQFEQDIVVLNNIIVEMSQNLKDKEQNSESLLAEKEQVIQTLQLQFSDETQKFGVLINELQEELKKQDNMKTHCEQKIVELNNKILQVSQDLNNEEETSKQRIQEKEQEINSLKQEHAVAMEKNCTIITNLQEEIKKQLEIKTHREQELVELNNKIIEMAQKVKDTEEQTNHLLKEKEKAMQALHQQFCNDSAKSDHVINGLQKNIKDQLKSISHCEQEMVGLNNKIVELTNTINNVEESSEQKLKINKQEKRIQRKFKEEMKQKETRNKILETEILETNNLKKACEQVIANLNNNIDELSRAVKDREESSKLALEKKDQEKCMLQKKIKEETEKLENTIENINKEREAEKHTQVVLKQEYQTQLQEKDALTKKLDQEVKHLTVCVSSLEERCQKIIEDNRKEVYSLNHEIEKLFNKVTEKSQTFTDLEEYSRLTLEQKVQEIQTQYQQFSAERDKSENIIKNLKIELEAEKYAQLKIKEDFDNRIMKLNEKILNRNNELVELQNNIIQKSEHIEVIQSDLRREKELRDELSNTCNHQLSSLNEQLNAIRTDLQLKMQEIKDLTKLLHDGEENAEKLKKEIENLNTSISNLKEKCRHRDDKIKEQHNEIEFLNDVYDEEKEKLNYKIDECNAGIKSLQMQLHNEIEYKLQLQEEISELKSSEQSLTEELKAAKIQMKTYEEKSIEWEEQKNKMEEQIQANITHIQKLEEDKIMLSKEIEVLKEIQSGEAKNQEEKIVILEKHKIEMDNKMKMNIIEVKKLEDEKTLLLKEINELKTAYAEEKKNHDENNIMREEQKTELNEQVQASVHKIKKLENEQAILTSEIEDLKELQIRQSKNHKEKVLLLEKQTNKMKEQILANNLSIETLENDKAALLNDVKLLKTAQMEENRNYADKVSTWNIEKMELTEKNHANVEDVKQLQVEKSKLVNEMETLQAACTEETKSRNENRRKLEKVQEENLLLLKEVEELKSARVEDANVWEKQKIELDELMHSISVKVEHLEEENSLLLKEIEELKTLQTNVTKQYEENSLSTEKQICTLKEQIETKNLKIEKLENEKSALLKEIQADVVNVEQHKVEKAKLLEEMAALQAARTEETKNRDENTLKFEKLQEEHALLLKEVEELKSARIEDSRAHEENKFMWGKQKIELDEQMHAHSVKIEHLEEEKSSLLNEIAALKSLQINITRQHEDNNLTLEKQINMLKEQVETNNLNIEKLEDEKSALLKEIDLIQTAQTNETKVYEENRLIFENQISNMNEKLQDSLLKVEKLEEEKEMLLKEMETFKTVESREMKDREEKALLWVQEKAELNSKLQENMYKVKELEEVKLTMTKKIEELIGAQTYACFKKEHEEKIQSLERQEAELKEQIKADAVKVEMLEQEKTMLLKELEALKAAQREMMAAASQEKITATKYSSWEKEIQGMQQVDTTTSDLAHSSMESLKTISDLEKIIQDKNRKITSMQVEISYIKSMMAESGIKLIDVTKELEVSRDTCEELSLQLKKIVQQKNEEIADLKRQVAKMSATENRASQIIKVSAKYQAMILKRIAEIKSSAVLKELTNFGNQNSNSDELRRSIGSVTMEDLENFLETTDRHLKRCSEKQMSLQKDRDRLSEVNRINESEIINMKKFLTEMSVSFRTFTTVKEVYNQKLSKIVSLQRTVRREILSLDGRITEATMCKLERGYAAVMQDLSECAMNLERWVDRSVSRMLSAEKIKQAFTSDLEQASLSTGNYQNAAVEVQLSELENSFQKLLSEIGRAQKGEGARTAQEVTIMEVRAEYEDKLNRMKAKMKELFHEEMGRLKQKQADEIAILERELVKCKEKMAESSKAYEEHIRALTTELWSVGEKFLVKKEEADWLRKKQSGSLMSLQHVHSSGLHSHGHGQEMFGRTSDTHSLRSLPVHNKKPEARGLHMSDEEGEVFDNRFLKELAATPRASLAPGQRISELKRRNSLVPPHLKSSYPAEMQFAPTLDEEDIKCASASFSLGRPQRKEVGITAYKKPGPPTPSKQAGRLSATDSELRENLRVEADPGRKTSTPSRIRSLFRSNRNDPADVATPRSRRFSSIFRKK